MVVKWGLHLSYGKINEGRPKAGKDENKIGLIKVMGFGEEGGINDVLRKRCVDEKAAVRKAALDCIRKAAISALSESFRKFHDDNVTKEWLHSVPRLIADNETSIQEECENLFLELVLDRITRAGSNADFLERNQHEVLSLLKEICHGEVTPWVKKIAPPLYIQAWLINGKICLADDKLAKRYIPLFVQEMENSNDAALRNNIIILMADFFKKAQIQNTIPMFIEIKRLRESKNSPLTGSLMELLRILLKDYKSEIYEIMLVADKQLQKELSYDMQKYKTLKAKSTAAEAVSTGKGVSENHLNTSSKVSSPMAGARAEVTAKSVLRDVN
nr:condensin-2 complex subunit D3 [Tanacetum cinerariifolium]